MNYIYFTITKISKKSDCLIYKKKQSLSSTSESMRKALTQRGCYYFINKFRRLFYCLFLFVFSPMVYTQIIKSVTTE